MDIMLLWMFSRKILLYKKNHFFIK